MSHTEVQATLDERGTRDGKFEDNALITQRIKHVIRTDKWLYLTAVHQEALDMIAAKIARIINGDPNYADSWRDIAEYATLAERSCKDVGNAGGS